MKTNEQQIKKFKLGRLFFKIFLWLFSIILLFIILGALIINDLNSIVPFLVVLIVCILSFIAAIIECNKQIKIFEKLPGDQIFRSNHQFTPKAKLYSNDGESYEIAKSFYLKDKNLNEEDLTQQNEYEIWSYSYDDITYLLAWIFENDYYNYENIIWNNEEKENIFELINDVKKRKATPDDYLMTTDGNFFEDEINNEIIGFVKYYLDGLYDFDLKKYYSEELKTKLYGFEFKWNEYDKFKEQINKAYNNYNQNLKK